jgi:hypothetical protein
MESSSVAGTRRRADSVEPAAATGRGRLTRVHVAGLLLVVAATGFRAWAIRPAWFFYDDFFFIQKARAQGLTADYLVQPYNGHLMPLSWALTWANARLDPFGFQYPAAEIVMMFALAGLAGLSLFVTLFGARWAALVPLVLFLFSPILLPATTWWAAGVNQLPMLAAAGFALSTFVRHLQRGRGRDLVLSLLSLAIGLGFVERTLVVVPMMWLVAVLYFASGTLPERLAHVWRTFRTAVVAHAVLLGAYLAVYVPFAMNFDATSITSRPLFGVLGNMAGIAFPSGLVGGPLRWHRSDITQSEAAPLQLVLILAWLVLAAVVYASIRTRRRGARAWLLPVTVLLVNSVLIATSRAIFFGAEIALDYRFQTELALIMPMAIGLAFLPVRGAVESAEPVESTWRVDARGTVFVSLVVFLVASLVSTASFPLRDLGDTSPRRYVDNFESSARADPGRQVLDLPTPAYMWAPFAYPTNLASRMLDPLSALVRFEASTTDRAWRVGNDGRLIPLDLPEARAQKAEVGADGCFDTLTGGTTMRWALDGPVVGIQWFIRLSYRTTQRTEVTVSVDQVDRKATLEPGQHYLVTPAPGQYQSVGLTIPEGSAPVCLLHLGIVAVDQG